MFKSNLVDSETKRILNAVTDGVYITDKNGVTVFVNDAYQQISELSADQLIGKQMSELIEQGHFKKSASLMVIKEKRTISILEHFCQDQLCLVTASPVFNDQDQLMMVITTIRPMKELNDAMEQLAIVSELNDKYYQELLQLRSEKLNKELIIGNSQKMNAIFTLIDQMAFADTTVLIQGETGTGKEIVATQIHKSSLRNKGPFIQVNCSAIPEALFESEMFGYVKGAFTGASKEGKAGLIELADHGTLLLDEISEMDIGSQTKLLRVLQDKKVQRIGSAKSHKIDVRIIAATNKDLKTLVESKKFREDLYYRISVIPITLPPLRERKADIPLFIDYFLQITNQKMGINKTIDVKAQDLLVKYDWPGNVRQLRNLVERLVVTCPDQVITQNDVLQALGDMSLLSKYIVGETSLNDLVANLEKRIISESLIEHKTTREAAKHLGISQPTLVRKTKKYQIKINNNL